MKPLLEYRGVSKHFGEVSALVDVSLTLGARTLTAIVGESGCGKSTLLQLANGLLKPSSGEVRVFGAPLPSGSALTDLRRRIGYAVQGVGLFPHLTARQNVTLVARLAGMSAEKIDARYAELCGLLELPEEIADRYPPQLSGGQQQRVGICRALMQRPRLVLLDEPFSAVDPITRRSIHMQFDRARRHEGSSVLLVTHDISEARRLADRLVIMRAGRIEQAGTLAEVFAAPANAYVAELLEGAA